MKKVLFLVALLGLTVSFANASSSTDLAEAGLKAAAPVVNGAFRVSGTVLPIGGGCYIFADDCTGVNYILQGDQSVYNDGNTYCAMLKAVAPTNCGVSAEFEIKSIQPGACPGNSCN